MSTVIIKLTEAGVYKKRNLNFTEEELSYILSEFKRIQSQYPLGVCLSKDVHMEFHRQYGYGNNTEKQWNEFINKMIA